ncbi:MAG TPA: peptidylprolyl isomerase [Myxococcales bacterium]|jgi:parvulin-like peptidyl-prolyl isomerase|nr:peptidylprolyl isomerase [Myxococcales bacterium]
MKRLFALLLFAAACGDKTALAEVGRQKLHQADLDAFVAGRPARQQTPEEALRELADSALFAEGAREQGLAADPKIKAKIAAAEREILRQALVDRAREPAATEAALRDRYQKEKPQLARKRVHVAAIVIRRGSGSAIVEQAKTRAFALRGQLEKGDDFAALAKKVSDDSGSAAKGGDLGPLFEGQVDPAFFAAAFGLGKGQTSQPLELPFAFFILRALEDPTYVEPTFAEARPQLEVKARSEAEASLLDGLRKSTSIQLHPERVTQPSRNRAP